MSDIVVLRDNVLGVGCMAFDVDWCPRWYGCYIVVVVDGNVRLRGVCAWVRCIVWIRVGIFRWW